MSNVPSTPLILVSQVEIPGRKCRLPTLGVHTMLLGSEIANLNFRFARHSPVAHQRAIRAVRAREPGTALV